MLRRILGAVVIVVIVAAAAAAQSKCKSVSGKVEFEIVSGLECSSPTGLCTRGKFTGTLSGSSEFGATSLIPTADTPATGVVLYTGDLVLHTKGGDLLLKDAGSLRTTGTGDVVSLSTVVGGTGEWAGATGTLQFTGYAGAQAGTSDFRGQICTP